ncbi:MAG TPA: PKD domain-containing protein [Thermoanaerobaculia bacterium]
MVTPFARRTLLSLAFVALTLMGSSAAVHAYQTQPPAGTITETTTRLELTGGGLVAPNVSGLCVTGTEDCDIYLLDVNLPADYAATHPNAKIRITVGWQNPSADYDVYLVTRPGFEPIDDAAGAANPEVIQVPAPGGNNQWEIDIVGYLPLGETYTATVELIGGGTAPADADGDGVPDLLDQCPGTPAGTPVDAMGCPLPGDRFCELPGKLVAADDNTGNAGDAANNGGVGVYDVEWLKVSTPKSADNQRQIAFTMKLKSLSPQPPPDARYLAFFTGADGLVYFAGMTTFPDENGGQPVFRFGTGESAFDDLGFGAPGSSYDVDGTITIVVPADRLGGAVAPGGVLTDFRVGARVSPGAGGAAYLNGADLDEAAAVADFQMPAMGACGEEEGGGGGGGPVTIGGPDFSLHVSPAGIADGAAEPTLDVNTRTGSIFFIAGTEVDRVKFDDGVSPARDTWEDKTGTLTGLNTADPILVADRDTGRIFASQLVLGPGNSIQEYSDTDGESWEPSVGGSFKAGLDHQALGVGPYPAGVQVPHTYLNAVYYCSQDLYAAYCSRSDNGGVTFGASVPVYTLLQCGGLHGHPKVAPDGTVYLPNKGCTGGQALIVSEDAGQTWEIRPIPGSGQGRWDPSVAVASDGTLYAGYMEQGNDKAMVVVSHDKGLTWSDPVDVGAPYGIRNAVFPAVVAGDPLRAAYFFLGTTKAGHSGDPASMGNTTADPADDAHWYAYVATTYDGGANWTVRNVTPDDPVQRGAICDGGFNSPCEAAGTRNLLDFNDAIMDEKGRVLAAFADGCTGPCVTGGTNSLTENGVIVRQASGRRLLAAHDPPDPTVPGTPSLSGRRDAAGAHLTWTQPLPGGAPITRFRVYRGTSPDVLAHLADSTSLTRFDDTSVQDGVRYYYAVSAVNSFGESGQSNQVALLELTVAETACIAPGLTLLTDASGDSTGGVAALDIRSVRVAEPGSLPGKVAFTYKVGDLAAVPPATRWVLRFKTSGTLPAGAEDWFVGMTTIPGETSTSAPQGPRFVYGTTGVPTLPVAGAVPARVFTVLGDLSPGSGFAPDGTIFLLLDKALVGATTPGDAIVAITPSIRAQLTPNNQLIYDDAGSANYTLRAANACEVNQLPLAALAASGNAGPAPLTVSFDASASQDPDGSIAAYVLDPGDGSPLVQQTSPIFSHVYSATGQYFASLRVQDDRGGHSANTATAAVDVRDNTDTDGDGVPDSRDECPGTQPGTPVNSVGCPVTTQPDRDGDGIPDRTDNCKRVPNPDQADRDRDGKGDACDRS